MGQGVIHRLDAVVVIHEIFGAVRATDCMGSLYAQLPFQWFDENLKRIKEQRVGCGNNAGDFGVDQSADDYRPYTIGDGCCIDLTDKILCLFGRIDERNRDFLQTDAVKLGQQAVPQHFGSNAGAV